MLSTLILAATLAVSSDALSVKTFVENCESRLPSVLETTQRGNPHALRPLTKQERAEKELQLKRLRSKDASSLELLALTLGEGDMELGSVRQCPRAALPVNQILDEHTVALDWQAGATIYLTGLPTAGLVVGKSLPLPGWVEVTETRNGRFVLAPFDIEAARQLWRERHASSSASTARR